MTETQSRVLDFIGDYMKDHRVSPTFQEIADAFGWKSLGTVAEHVKNLEHQGYLIQKFNEPRGLRVTGVCPCCGRS